MAKRKRGLILATFMVSGTAVIISIVSLVTQEWVISEAQSVPNTAHALTKDYVRFGLFGGIFKQTSSVDITYELTMVCIYEKNICALLCGNNMERNLRMIYEHRDVAQADINACSKIISNSKTYETYDGFFTRTSNNNSDKFFINGGVLLSTLIFLCLSICMGILSTSLAFLNTIFDPKQPFIRIFGLYTYNALALLSITLSLVIWGAWYAKDMLLNEVPTYKTFLEKFTTKGFAKLGYSYWINLAPLGLYLISLVLLYFRNYIIAQEILDDVDSEPNAIPMVNYLR